MVRIVLRRHWRSVALLAEGVDRNCIPVAASTAGTMSPSSRRAWIEILSRQGSSSSRRVALLAEGVDRNSKWFESYTGTLTSPSSRRAWIEILWSSSTTARSAVALLAEGVDRNNTNKGYLLIIDGRPPRGGRG